MTVSREIRLKSRPEGLPKPETFELASVEVQAPGPGEIQVKNLWMSVDPYMRGRMYDRKSYIPPFQVGQALQGGAIGEVTASQDPDFKPGDIVSSLLGWREVFNIATKSSAGKLSMLEKLDTQGLPPQAFLGAAGMPGMTAYVGLLKIAALKPGDVVFVSAAAGAVGSIVCQIAKLKGHTVIGSAGGASKCALLKEFGVDHAIDYKGTSDLAGALQRVAPDGIDVYFDNVGGAHLEAALSSARPYGRIALCGMISQYNNTEQTPGPSNLMFAVGKSLRLEGFIVSNHNDVRPAFRRIWSSGFAKATSRRKRRSTSGSRRRPRPSSSSSAATTSARCSSSSPEQYS
jgi:NADPH-dependent curcumin reductase CurA